jgi:hypothetical protein
MPKNREALTSADAAAFGSVLLIAGPYICGEAVTECLMEFHVTLVKSCPGLLEHFILRVTSLSENHIIYY